MPAGEGPSAACAVFKARGDSTKTRENMHLTARPQKTAMRPYIALRLHCAYIAESYRSRKRLSVRWRA